MKIKNENSSKFILFFFVLIVINDTLKASLANMRKSTNLALLFSFFLIVSCNPGFRSASVEYVNYNIQPRPDQKSLVSDLIKPYSDSINKTMNNVIGENVVLLEKSIKNNTLGYLMTDAFLFMANQKFKINVDAAFMNYGGIRLNELAKGKITNGKIFELMPFDNLLLLQKVSGKILKQYLDTMVSQGMIVQSGLTLQVTNKKVEKILINNKPLDENSEYIIANSDYIINSSEILKSIPVQNIGYLQRDAILEYVSHTTQKGERIMVKNLNRVVYVE